MKQWWANYQCSFFKIVYYSIQIEWIPMCIEIGSPRQWGGLEQENRCRFDPPSLACGVRVRCILETMHHEAYFTCIPIFSKERARRGALERQGACARGRGAPRGPRRGTRRGERAALWGGNDCWMRHILGQPQRKAKGKTSWKRRECIEMVTTEYKGMEKGYLKIYSNTFTHDGIIFCFYQSATVLPIDIAIVRCTSSLSFFGSHSSDAREKKEKRKKSKRGKGNE